MKLTSRSIFVWFFILSIYLLVLVGIGQVAFTKQYFNEADSMVGEFLEIKKKYAVEPEKDADTDSLINSLMEESANSSNDLQELASQSFNIILGALLAFLSASATVVFQELQNRSSDEPDDDKEKREVDNAL
ncbi:hypothetical protein KIH87_06100 [Paraneptunicella aestuarii]|uniref:hypothetical protein n=1 Tax=Paraneptunicella aestuarii TaxID=2831148 RepID=UPI001E2D267A|nr:hypothetical protein [Paraneptunicella aestuarii]UAA39923.1 hypothetical protein KIH87_06100 [Paraneptunicella aestuarii]